MQNRKPSRRWGLVGDLLSLLGVGMIAFTLFTLWQEGPEALLVTVSPNRSAYQRRLGYSSLPELPGQRPPAETLAPEATPPPSQVAEAAEPLPAVGASPQPAPILDLLPTAPRGVHPVRINIAKIGIDAPVVEVGAREMERDGQWIVEWETADNAAGHLAGTGNAGIQGNVVLAGHNNIRGQVFRRLDRLIPGDEVELFGENGEQFRYVVREAVIVPEEGEPDAVRDENARYLLPTRDARLTLVSCWPYWTNTHRIIVVALLAGS